MMQRKVFIQENKSSDPAKTEERSWEGEGLHMAACEPPETTGAELRVRWWAGDGSFSAPVPTAGCDPWTKIRKGKLKEKICFSFLRASYCLAFLVTTHLFPSCQHADN